MLCSKCHQEKNENEFYKSRREKDGRRSECKDCGNKYNATNKVRWDNTYYERHKDKLKKRSRLFYLENRERVLKREKIYQIKNKDKKSEYDAKRFQKIYQSVKKQRISYCNKWRRKKYKEDVGYKIRTVLRNRFKQAFKNGKFVDSQGCTMDELKIYLQSQFQDGMNWGNYGCQEGQWSIDHIYPLSKFDLTKESERMKAFHYSNLQPLWHRDNLRKSNKIVKHESVK